MKKTRQLLNILFFSFLLVIGCSKDNNIPQEQDPTQQEPMNPDMPDNPDPTGQFEMVDVQIILPQGSEIDIETTTVFTLAMPSNVSANGIGKLPYNAGTAQLTYLMDLENNLLLAGFLTDDRKEISVATTAEVMLYFGLGYQLLSDNVKPPYVNAVQQIDGFSNFISEIETLFTSNPLMYTEGTYESVLNTKINEITAKETIDIAARIEVDSGDSRSGITISAVDASNIQVQNSYPRRAHTFVYKKSSTDLDGNETQISNYTSSPLTDFKLEPGGTDIGVQNSGITIQQQCNAASQGINENSVTSEPLNLPVRDDELSAEYEVVVVGPGTRINSYGRNFTAAEQTKYEELSKEAFILDKFLPTLLDIGGNKGLLPPVGDTQETALVNIVLPFLEANTDVLALVINNDFDAASKDFIPFLYEDIRQSNDLRQILTGVYNTINGGDFPNTFIQSQELIETGEARYKALTRIINNNINSNNNKCNNYRLNDSESFESWGVKSSNGKVKVGPELLNILFDEVGDISVEATVDLEEGQTLEYDWMTSGTFGGRIQDINGDPSNFGISITTTEKTVSFSSVALEADLGSGDNIENVTVTAFVKYTNGSRDEIGSDQMRVNIKKLSFVITPDEVSIKGGKNVALRIRHNDGSTSIPSETTDYKLVWKTTGNYGQLSGRNTVETRYNDNLILFQSQDEVVERGEDQVSVQIYARPKDGSSDYRLVDDAKATIITKNDPNCDFDLYPLQFEERFFESDCSTTGTGYQALIMIRVPKDEAATSYSVVWNEIIAYNGNEVRRSGKSWTNEVASLGGFDVDEGGSFLIYSGFGAGFACSDNTGIPETIARTQQTKGYATVTVCYD
ncbi:MAG: hypothetical protein WBB27_06350 [Maribacter sp.]